MAALVTVLASGIMKTFFLALILGAFAGALVTSYFSEPGAHEKLQASKRQLLQQDDPAIETEAPPTEEEIIEPEAPTEQPPPEKEAPTETIQPEETLPEVDQPPEEELSAPVETIEEPSPEIETAEPIEPETPPLPSAEETIEVALRVLYQSEESGDLADIEVAAKGSEVSLRGSVPSVEARLRAIEIALAAPGVESVQESLKVETEP